MATRTVSCINPSCAIRIRFTSVEDLLAQGMRDLRTRWDALADEPPVPMPLCTHDRARGQARNSHRTAQLSDLIQADFAVPGWIWARRKVGLERDFTTGMPLDVEPPVSPILKLYELRDELRYIYVPMAHDAAFGEPIPQRATLELPHLSALTGLRYGALLAVLGEIPGRITTERTVRFATREFWRWWQTQRDRSAA